MAFEALADLYAGLDALPVGNAEVPQRPPLKICSFADDLVLPSGRPHAVRVVARTDAGLILLDLRDSDDADADGFGATIDDVRVAAIAALGHALGCGPDRRLADVLAVETSPKSWVGARPATDPGRRLMTLARIFDAVLGALASGWPQRVGAGSCSLGAVVELTGADDAICEVVPGGEGATSTRPGRGTWNSPIAPTRTAAAFPRWLSLTQASRTGSGGGGARRGGEGVVRTYRVDAPVTACVGLDRITNPPHGIDRAGPPAPAAAWLETPGQPRVDVTPWTSTRIPAGSTLGVETCGGAGHGFGGYGEIAFDPAGWP